MNLTTAGICGNRAPDIFGGTHRRICTLRADHIGWHESPDGMSWGEQHDTLTDAGHPVERVAVGFTCAVHRHREYVPLNVHHIVPRGMGGPDAPGNRITLCMNAHGLVHEVIRRLMDHGGTIPDREHFGAKVVALAMRGWEGAGRPTKGSGGE